MENKVAESNTVGSGGGEKRRVPGLEDGSGRNRKELAWFLRSVPFPWPLWNQERFFRELSGEGTDNPTKLFRRQTKEFRVFWLLFSKTGKHLVNGKEKKGSIKLSISTDSWTPFSLCSGLISLSSSLSNPQAIPTLSLLQAFQQVRMPISYKWLGLFPLSQGTETYYSTKWPRILSPIIPAYLHFRIGEAWSVTLMIFQNRQPTAKWNLIQGI